MGRKGFVFSRIALILFLLLAFLGIVLFVMKLYGSASKIGLNVANSTSSSTGGIASEISNLS